MAAPRASTSAPLARPCSDVLPARRTVSVLGAMSLAVSKCRGPARRRARPHECTPRHVTYVDAAIGGVRVRPIEYGVRINVLKRGIDVFVGKPSHDPLHNLYVLVGGCGLLGHRRPVSRSLRRLG
jgi:hypothetical protein